MRLRSTAAAVVAAALLAAVSAPAVAQEDPDNNGRYTIVNGVVSAGPGSPEQRVTLLLDTQAGRTWMIATGPEGIHWMRLQLKAVGKVPDNMSLRPGPVQPFAPSK